MSLLQTLCMFILPWVHAKFTVKSNVDGKVIYMYICTLQKQSGCFNQRVATLVAVKMKDSGYEMFTTD